MDGCVIMVSKKFWGKKSAKNLACCRKFCPLKNFVHLKVFPLRYRNNPPVGNITAGIILQYCIFVL